MLKYYKPKWKGKNKDALGKKKTRKYDHNLGGKQSFPIQDMNGTNQKEKIMVN